MLDALLRKGYLPDGLPPIFGSEPLADCLKIFARRLPDGFTRKEPQWTLPAYHNLARPGGLRRRLSAPNPVNFFRLARAFDSGAAELGDKWALSPYSITKPTLVKDARRALANPSGDLATFRPRARVGMRYVLQADIAQFYASVYTHTIAWALHTKEEAKRRRRDLTLLGNSIDREVQACQDGQTKGIAVGPDTSLGIAELILGQVDLAIAAVPGVCAGVRFIDDMEFGFRTLSEAETALHRLESILCERELQLNSNKTRIVELPDATQFPYVSRIRSCIPPDHASPSQWAGFFDTAFLLAKEYKDLPVLRYAIGCISGAKVGSDSWEIVQALLWQSTAGDPGCLRLAVDMLLANKTREEDLVIDKSMAEDAINALICRSAPVGHGSEVLWSIWAALCFDLRLSAVAAEETSSMDDPFVAVAALFGQEKRIFAASLSMDTWETWFHPGCFQNEHWLLTYEAFCRGWMADSVRKAEIDSDESSVFLKTSGVSFLVDQAVEDYKPVLRQASIY